MAISNLIQAFNLARTAIEMHPENCTSGGRNQGLNSIRVDVVSVRINITENRLYPLPMQRMGRGNERE